MKKEAEKILEYLGNKKTQVEEKEDFKGNYYSYLTDTIYLSKNFLNKEQKDNKNISNYLANVIMICHECIHSIQKRYLHILNTVFSNLSILVFVICLITRIIENNIGVIKAVGLIMVGISIVIRLLLETEAIDGSINLVAKLMKDGLLKDVDEVALNDARKHIKAHKLFALSQMIFGKIICLVILIMI